MSNVIGEIPESVSTWQEAEAMAAQHMRSIGFPDAVVTGPGTDGGVDVISQAAIAQVKFHALPVGSPDVQRLKGAAHERETALFYSASGYTEAAKLYAEKAGIALFVIGPWSQVAAVNNVAKQIAAATSKEDAGAAQLLFQEQRDLLLGRVSTLAEIWTWIAGHVADAPHMSVMTVEELDQLEPTEMRLKASFGQFSDAHRAGTKSPKELEVLADAIETDVRAMAAAFGFDMDSVQGR